MLLSSHVPMFLANCQLWSKIALSHQHVILGGTVVDKEYAANRLKLRDSNRSLALVSKTKGYPYADLQFVRWSLAGIVESLDQELCCKRFPYHGRLTSILDCMSDFEGVSFLELVVKTNKAIAQTLGLECVFYVDKKTDFNVTRTVGTFVSALRHQQGAFTYVAGPELLPHLNKHEVPMGRRLCAQKPMPVFYGGNTVLQLIAAEPDPLTMLLQVSDLDTIV